MGWPLGPERLEGRVVPAVITVMNPDDAGAGSLRDAITQADRDTTPDTITFAPGLTGTIALLSALPDLAHTLTIDGPGPAALTVSRSFDANDLFRIFTVPAGADVAISGLTISGGHLAGDGGGISNAGTLSVTHCNISDTLIDYGGAGGGIYNNAGSTLTVTDSILSGNSAGSPVLFLGIGGGIDNAGALTVTNSALIGNDADEGGGLANGGTVTVSDSTISGNSAEGPSGSPSTGGGIDNGGTVTVTDSTVSGNSATSGGGILNGAKLTVTASIFADPTGGNLALDTSSGGLEFVSLGHNLFTDKPAVPFDPTDLTGTDPLLGPLGNYGGPTMSQALLPGSPAIDAGAAVPGVTTDQRGVARTQGAAPDIGAFESRGFRLAVVAGGGQRTPAGSPFPAPSVVAVSSPSGEPVAGGRVTVAAPPSGPSAGLVPNPAPLGASGQAFVHATANGSAGAYTVTARAAGADSVAVTLTNTEVVRATATQLIVTPASSLVGHPVTSTAVVFSQTGSAAPAGTVTFIIDGAAQRPVPLATAFGQGRARFTTSALSAGRHTITALYNPRGHFAGSASGALTQVVNAAPPQTPATRGLALWPWAGRAVR